MGAILRHAIRGMAVALGLAMLAAPAAAQPLPGDGRTIRYAQSDSLGGNYVADQILITGFRRLGYEVATIPMGVTLFFQAAAQGDVDVMGGINFPQREAAYEQVKDRLALVGEGSIAEGGINGYLIDKKTANAQGITRLDQLQDPKIARLFATDGKAGLVSCDPGWACGDIVDYQIAAFGLKDSVAAVRGKYEALMGEVVARVRRGEPVLYYAWSPSWVMEALVPGRDVVWLPTPFDALPPGVTAKTSALVPGVTGCAGGQDPCRMALGAWNDIAVANRAFLAENPAVQRLLEQARWPLATWNDWEGAINRDGSSNHDLKRLADAWIATHQAEFDGWVAQAMTAQ